MHLTLTVSSNAAEAIRPSAEKQQHVTTSSSWPAKLAIDAPENASQTCKKWYGDLSLLDLYVYQHFSLIKTIDHCTRVFIMEFTWRSPSHDPDTTCDPSGEKQQQAADDLWIRNDIKHLSNFSDGLLL